MIDIFYLILMIIFGIFILLISIYIIDYFSTSEEQGCVNNIFLKIIAIIGLMMVFIEILLLPLDVSNIHGKGGKLNMNTFWIISFIIIFVFSLVIIPLMINIYELDPDLTTCEKIKNGFLFFIIDVIIFSFLFFILFLCFNKANIPFEKKNCSIYGYQNSNDKTILFDKKNCIIKTEDVSIKTHFLIFSFGLMSFGAYFLLTVFGGIGIVALPLDLIRSFMIRPIKISKNRLEEMKKEIVQTSIDLKELAKKVKSMEEKGFNKKYFWSKEKKQYNQLFNELKVGVNIIDEQFQLINIQNAIGETSIIQYYLSLIIGIIFLIFSIIWIIHIVLYVLLKKFYFLNNLLSIFTNNGFTFLSTFLFGFLCFYLLICIVKGNFKFGIRFIILGSVHPMKKNETYMNSILFNIMLILITSVSLIHFCVKAFNEYVSMTDIDIIFSILIKNLSFFKYFFKYNIFEWIFCGIMLISFIYLIFRSNDVNTIQKILYEKIENEKKTKNNLIELNET